jgi:hypothetical protein
LNNFILIYSCKANPNPELGPIRHFLLHETSTETHHERIIFEINYILGTYRKFKLTRPIHLKSSNSLRTQILNHIQSQLLKSELQKKPQVEPPPDFIPLKSPKELSSHQINQEESLPQQEDDLKDHSTTTAATSINPNILPPWAKQPYTRGIWRFSHKTNKMNFVSFLNEFTIFVFFFGLTDFTMKFLILLSTCVQHKPNNKCDEKFSKEFKMQSFNCGLMSKSNTLEVISQISIFLRGTFPFPKVIHCFIHLIQLLLIFLLLVSDIDVVVIGPLPQGNGTLFALAKHLKQSKIALNVDVIDRARVRTKIYRSLSILSQ